MASCLKVSVKDGVRIIRFNNPRKRNAISTDGYQTIANILNSDATNDSIIVTIFTGEGDYYTSGNDLTSGLTKLETMTMEDIIDSGVKIFSNMVQAFINYPKILISVVNGPAIGIGVTISGLCDVVYASETATFQTPFIKLGLCIEGCGSYMLPRIMGRSKATELLLFGHKMDAREALQFNLISKIIPKNEIEGFIVKLHDIAKLPHKALVFNKKLITDNLKIILSECNKRECKQLHECQHSEEFFNNITAFTQRSKL